MSEPVICPMCDGSGRVPAALEFQVFPGLERLQLPRRTAESALAVDLGARRQGHPHVCVHVLFDAAVPAAQPGHQDAVRPF